MRKVMKSKQLNWQDSIWKTEAQALTWLRGQLRRIWTNWPLKTTFKNSMLEEVQPHHNMKSNKVKRVGVCNKCKGYFASSNLEVDHIEQAGYFGKTPDSVGLWLFDLLTSTDNMQLLCKPCHKIKSHSDRVGCTFEEAEQKKKIIAFKKLTDEEQKIILSQQEVNPANTKAGRVRQFSSI